MTSALPVTSVYRGCIRRLPAYGPDYFRMSLTPRGVPARLVGARRHPPGLLDDLVDGGSAVWLPWSASCTKARGALTSSLGSTASAPGKHS